MACRQLILFPAIYRDGELLPCATEVFIDCSITKINGTKTERAWDAEHQIFSSITGFFISYKGIEYGSTEIDQDAYFVLAKAACGEDFQIFDFEFDFEFE